MNDKILIGDVVRAKGFHAPVVVICGESDIDTEVKVMNSLGDTAWLDISKVNKTGEHCTQIAEVFSFLKKMGGTQHDD